MIIHLNPLSDILWHHSNHDQDCHDDDDDNDHNITMYYDQDQRDSDMFLQYCCVTVRSALVA